MIISFFIDVILFIVHGYHPGYSATFTVVNATGLKPQRIFSKIRNMGDIFSLEYFPQKKKTSFPYDWIAD